MPPTAVPQDHKRKKSQQQEDKYAPTVWGTGGGLEDLVVPSGQMCLVKRPGVQNLIEAGVLRDIDTLSAIVAEKHIKRVEGEDPDIDTDSLAQDPEAIVNVLHVVDRVVTYCVVKPEILMTPNDPTSRKDGVIYADMVDIEDKMFVFNYAVGGTRSVEQFRQGSVAPVGSVDTEQAVEEAAE